MELNNFVLSGAAIAGVLAIAGVVALFFVSRKSQKAMESMLLLLTKPERAKIQDAARVLHVVMADEITKIEDIFKAMQDALVAQIGQASALEKELGARNSALVELADEAVRKISTMSSRLESTAGGFQTIVNSHEWAEVEASCERFQSRINELLNRIDSVSNEATEHARVLQGHIESWVGSGKTLSAQLQSDIGK